MSRFRQTPLCFGELGIDDETAALLIGVSASAPDLRARRI
jgi:hypothetical protein